MGSVVDFQYPYRHGDVNPFDAPYIKAYHEAGWKNFIPLPYGSQWPPPSGFTGRKALSISKQQYLEWLKESRQAGAKNIAIVLPEDIISIDVDDYGDKHGGRDLAKLEEHIGKKLPTKWISTARGHPNANTSGQRFFRLKPQQSPRLLKYHDKPAGSTGAIEIVRWGHRYSVVWPSVNGRLGAEIGANVARYTWYYWDEQQNTWVKSAGPPKVEDLSYLPDEWVEHLTGGFEKLDESSLSNVSVEHGQYSRAEREAWIDDRSLNNSENHDEESPPCRLMRNALAKVLDDLRDEGTRHDTMRDAVMHAYLAAREGHSGIKIFLGQLHNRYVDMVQDKRGGLNKAEDEWQRSEIGAFELAINKKYVVDRNSCPCPKDEVDVAEAEQLIEAAFFTVEEYRNPPEPIPTTYGKFGGKVPLFYAEGVHWLFGESESGKSWIALCVALEVLRAGGKVLYLDYEKDRKNILARLVYLGATEDEVTRCARIDGRYPLEYLKAYVTAHHNKFACFIVDANISGMSAWGHQHDDLNERITGWTNDIPARFKMSIVVDHPKKGDSEGWAIGGQAKKSVVTGSSWEVKCTKKFGRTEKFDDDGKVIGWEVENGTIRLENQKDEPSYLAVERKKAIILSVEIDPKTLGVSITRTAVGEQIIDGMTAVGESIRIGDAAKQLEGETGEVPFLNNVAERVFGEKSMKGRNREKTMKKFYQAEADKYVRIWKDGESQTSPWRCKYTYGDNSE